MSRKDVQIWQRWKIQVSFPAGFQGIFFEFGQKKACPPIEKDGGVNETIQQSLYTHPKNKNIKFVIEFYTKVIRTVYLVNCNFVKEWNNEI